MKLLTHRAEASFSLRRSRLALVVISLFAIAVGLGIPAYLSVVGSSFGALLALPLALLLSALFFLERKAAFLLILTVRSACDVVFESARSSIGGGGPGIGGLVNAAVIGLAILVVSRDDLVRKKPVLMAWAWFFCTTCYGLVLSPSKPEALRFILAWVSNFAVFYCASCFVTSVKEFKNVLRVIIASSIIPVAYGLFAVAGGSVPSVVVGRVQSTFTHPNIFAFYLALVISIAFYQLKSPLFVGSAWKKAVLFIWMATLFGMLLSTQTRSAWLVCLLMFLFFGLLFERRYLVYLFALCCLALLVEPIRDRIIDLNAPEVETSQTKLDSFRWRIELWMAGLGWMEVKHYLLGYGIGGFSENSPIFFERGDGIHWDAHNVYVQWFFDVGLVGLVAYAWIHCRILYLLRHLARIDRVLSFIVIFTMLSYLTVSFSDNMMFYLAFNWYYWFFLGATSSLLTVTNIDVQQTSIPNEANGRNMVCK